MDGATETKEMRDRLTGVKQKINKRLQIYGIGRQLYIWRNPHGNTKNQTDCRTVSKISRQFIIQQTI